jgi:RsmE family RNA methyltransferase
MGRRRVPQALTPRALPRFFVPPATLQTRTLPDPVAHQVYRVLRLQAGDWVCLLDGAGGVFLAQLGERGRIETLQPSALATELPFAVTVLQAMVRPEKAETAIRLCVQAGAQAIWFAPASGRSPSWSLLSNRRANRAGNGLRRRRRNSHAVASCPKCAC